MKQSHIEVTERIIEVSRPTRTAYLERMEKLQTAIVVLTV